MSYTTQTQLKIHHVFFTYLNRWIYNNNNSGNNTDLLDTEAYWYHIWGEYKRRNYGFNS